MAEALAERRFGEAGRFESAGLQPQPPGDARNAIETLQFEFGIDKKSHIPRDIRAVDLGSFDLVVAMDKEIAKELKQLTSRDIIQWEIDDPWSDEPHLYKRSALQILQQLSKLPIPGATPNPPLNPTGAKSAPAG